MIALALPMAAFAQTGVVATHPENNEGRMLTMEEAVMGIGTRPQTVAAMWVDANTYVCMEGREMKAYDALTGKEVEYKAEGRSAMGPMRGGMRGGGD